MAPTTMVLLSARFDPTRPRRSSAPWSALVRAILVAAAIAAVGLAVATMGGTWRTVGRAITSAAVHGGFLAIGWIVATGRLPTHGPLPFWSAGVLLVASVASRFTTWASLVYLLLPIILLRAGARDPALRDMGVGATAGLKPIALGVVAGGLLGAHLLVSASLTLGYAVRLGAPETYLASAAYDLGASVLSAEWLFRGALFSRWWRDWDFWPAAGASTALVVGRYLLDPALPATLEVRAGAVFYMTLLGFGCCALRASSGSLLPGYLAAGTFFLAYRMLAA